ncbi:hypothetical protein [Streptomyces sp. NPDC002535]
MSRNAERRNQRIRAIDALHDRFEQAVFTANRLHTRGGAWPQQIRVRSSFFATGRDGQPPIGRISAPRGLNLQVFLLALFEAQTRKRTGAAGGCPLPISGGINPWTELVVSEAKQNTQAKAPITATQNRARQIKSAMKRLTDAHLALQNVGNPQNPYPFMLLHESGNSESGTMEYTIPDFQLGQFTVTLPVQFFTNGWIYLLTDAEIRMYLIFKHLATRFSESHARHGVYCNEYDRTWRYWVSRDSYEAHLTLSRFGLIAQLESDFRHADGKIINFHARTNEGTYPAHRFLVLGDSPFFESPMAKIRRALLNYPPSYSQMVQKRRGENSTTDS